MTEALLFVSVGCILSVGVAILIIATLTMQNGRRYFELAEAHMKYLREEQARLVAFLRKEHQSLKEELEREREQRLEAQLRAEWASREVRLPQRLSVGGLDQEQRLGAAQGPERQELWEPRVRPDIEHRIDELKREFQKLREVQRDREVEGESYPPIPKERLEDVLETPEVQGRTPRPARPPEPKTSDSAEISLEANKPRLAVWHPHPDDDVSPGRTSASPPGDSPVEMFRRHYDKYLENYEGYVKLVERIYQMRENAEVPPSSVAKREWEGRLRRVIDGIERTTARLDLLEEYNPELATDDRISRRASIARSYLELERSRH
jgi:hypothetical protein